jgi:pimeloyl-ACP methyl ester carboxylesterase
MENKIIKQNYLKETLVLVHGLGLGGWVFNENYAPYFRAQGYKVIVINLPGHSANSDAHLRQHMPLQQCVNHVEEVINNLSDPFVLLGMSLGGGICQRIMAENESRQNLKGAVLLSSVSPVNSLVFTLRMCQKMAVKAPNILVDFFRNVTNKHLVFSDTTFKEISSKSIDQYISQIIPGFSLLEYEVFFQDLFKQAPKIDLPLRVIGGEDDALFPPEVTKFIGSYYNTTPYILPGLGHMIPIESNYMKSIEVIEPFLREVF